MIGEFFLLIVQVILEIVKTFFWGVDWVIPAAADTALTNAMAEIGGFFDDAFHVIPASDDLLLIAESLIIVMTAYTIFRFFVFLYNSAYHSGGSA